MLSYARLVRKTTDLAQERRRVVLSESGRVERQTETEGERSEKTNETSKTKGNQKERRTEGAKDSRELIDHFEGGLETSWYWQHRGRTHKRLSGLVGNGETDVEEEDDDVVFPSRGQIKSSASEGAIDDRKCWCWNPLHA